MGRWGMRLFEGDQDLDIALEINETFDQKLELSKMVHQTDMLCPPLMRIYYETSAYEEELEEHVAGIRAKLDADGLGYKLIRHWRSKEGDLGGEYRVIIAGALLMRAGAKIEESEMQHLHEIVPRINCNSGFTLPVVDKGFRTPGRAQFMAALDHYQPGSPRNFLEPSCFHCGKVETDLGKELMKCGNCKAAYYCDKDCQRGQWKQHKPSCKDPNRAWSLNV
ncbi:hypothetical protein F4781DRAFT_265372 [Annulohypoxylon bovei var. microspora]|nr:hypothetical protein F4781DRAFT_265372 [Annulohypoxylon bovei var. microspora]